MVVVAVVELVLVSYGREVNVALRLARATSELENACRKYCKKVHDGSNWIALGSRIYGSVLLSYMKLNNWIANNRNKVRWNVDHT